MANTTSYYLYQKYVSRGGSEPVPAYPNDFSVDGHGTQQLVVKMTDDPDCGYTPTGQTMERWVATPNTICVQGFEPDPTDMSYSKYYVYKKQVSYDNGITWIDATPAETAPSGSPIATYDSLEQCEGIVPQVIYRWVNLDPYEDYYCVGTTKYYKQKKQQSTDNGSTWTDVSPAEYQRGELYSTDSTDCGYVPEPVYSFNFGDYIAPSRTGITVTIPSDTNTSSAYTIMSCVDATTEVPWSIVSAPAWANASRTDLPGLTSQLNINVSANTTADRSGTILMSQQTSGKEIELYLTQRAYCTPSSTVHYTVSNITAPGVAYTSTSNTVSWYYTEITDWVLTSCTETTTTESGSASQVVTYSQNNTVSAKTISGSYTWSGHRDAGGNDIVIPYSFTQSGRPCTCDDLVIPTPQTGISFSWNETAAATIPITQSAHCITNLAVTGTSNFSAATYDGNIYIKPLAQNTGDSAITDTVRVGYKASGTNCTKNIPVTQNPDGCDCNSMSLSPQTLEWAWNATGTSSVTISTTGECISNIAVSGGGSNHFTAYTNSAKTLLYVRPKSTNTGTTGIYEGVVLTYKSGSRNCQKSVTAIHDYRACTCADLTVNTASTSVEWDYVGAGYIPVTSAACVTNISLSHTDPTHFSVSTQSPSPGVSAIEFRTLGQNTGTVNDYQDTITISYQADGTQCSKTTTAIQKHRPCACSDLTLPIPATGISFSWSDTGTTNIPITSAACITTISAVSTSNFSARTANGYVYVKPKTQNTGSSERNETVKVRYRLGYIDTYQVCEKDVPVHQGVNPCQCSGLTLPDGNTVNWGWNELTTKSVRVSSSSCISNINVTFPSHYSGYTRSGYVYVKPRSNNTGSTSIIEGISITYKAGYHDCASSITCTQIANTCSCQNLTLSTNSLEFAYNSTTQKSVKITSASCITSIAAVSTTNFSARTANGYVYVKPRTQNTGSTTRQEDILVNYSANGLACQRYITATQPGYVCDCTNSLTYTSYLSWSAGDTTPKTVSPISKGDCVTHIESVEDPMYFIVAEDGNGTFTLYPSGTSVTTQLDIKYYVNGQECPYYISIDLVVD